jgi:SAM-dependent methyltransferase
MAGRRSSLSVTALTLLPLLGDLVEEGQGVPVPAGSRPAGMTSLRRQLGAQASKPSGIVGVVAAALMLVEGPSGCYHEAVAGRLDVQPDDVLLDVACGSALFLRRYAGRARRVAGLDHSPVQVGLACHVLRRRIDAGTAEVVAGDASAMPWAEGTFTAVTCNCLSCIGEGEQALAEMYRVLRPVVASLSPRTSAPTRTRSAGRSVTAGGAAGPWPNSNGRCNGPASSISE